jgi:23S rRNA (uracil1939-C5)-methyltransferase
MKPGDRIRLVAEKPAAGGRMIARHQGAIVLVAAAIPGETVEATIEKVQRGTVWARTTQVLERSPDRVDALGDSSCGGSVFAHIAYERQLALKQDIIRDAFARIGRMALDDPFPIAASPAEGYRMRARLHVKHGRLGFFREGSHELCDAGATRQLLAATVTAVRDLENAIRELPHAPISEVEIAENRAADQRAVHLDLRDDADPSRLGSIGAIAGVTGLSCSPATSHHALVLSGSPLVADDLAIPAAGREVSIAVQRNVRSFFQGNRFLLPDLVAAVVDAVPAGYVLDLYAGVGLFSLALAARGDTEVIAIEGERTAAHDLKRNASSAASRIAPRHQTVETFLATHQGARAETVVVDPPRTGLSKDAMAGTLALQPSRLVYVSCDVATLARDARTLTESGYRRGGIRSFDLFPNTAHVETVVAFDRT